MFPEIFVTDGKEPENKCHVITIQLLVKPKNLRKMYARKKRTSRVEKLYAFFISFQVREKWSFCAELLRNVPSWELGKKDACINFLEDVTAKKGEMVSGLAVRQASGVTPPPQVENR